MMTKDETTAVMRQLAASRRPVAGELIGPGKRARRRLNPRRRAARLARRGAWSLEEVTHRG